MGSTTTTTPRWRRRRRFARTSVLARCFFFLATMTMTTTTTKKAAVRVGLVAGETTITWTPGAPSATTAERGSGSVKETAATAPRSQRYWDEHGIERPDYAKTDAEIAAERLRSWIARFKLDDRDPRTRDGGRSRTNPKSDSKTSRKWSGRLFAAAALWGLLALGRQTESMHGSDLRAMWDETRKYSSACSRNDRRRRRVALVRAVLYESQPVRLSTLSRAARRIREELTSADNHRALRDMVEHVARLFVSAVRRVLRTWTLREYKSFVLYPLLYCCFVRFVHAKLDAGPLVVIATSLYLILTTGLDDGDGDNGGVSAYSVFNRGFRRLLGDVDAEELVAQHVGGGGGVGAAMAAAARQRREEARQEQQEEQRRAIEGRPLARDGDDVDDLAPPPPAARRSGKRARRRNLEERRERRRQRQAAIDMGLVGDELGDAEMIRIMENDGRADAD